MRRSDRRREKRVRRRLSCELRLEGRRCSGVILNLTSRGLFVQTRARAPLGTEAEVQLRTYGREEPIVLRAVVARAFLVPPDLVRVAGGGMGLRIRSAPDAYRGFLESIAPHGWLPEKPDIERVADLDRPRL